jgi:hypothetical protein
MLSFYLEKQTNKPKVPTKLVTSNVPSLTKFEAPKFDASMAIVNPCSPWALLETD